MSNILTSVDFVQELWMSSTNGLPQGETLDVPMNSCALIVHNGGIFYVLEPNRYLLTADNFPLLKPRRASKGLPPMLEGTLYLIRTDDINNIPWEQSVITTAHWYEGAPYEIVKGQYGVRIVNPPQFFQSIYSRLKATATETAPMKSFRLARPEADAKEFVATNLVAEANLFVSPILENTLLLALHKHNRPQEPITSHQETLQNEIGSLLAPKIEAHGVHILSFSVDSIATPASLPCQSCGSNERPTSNLGFYSNVSLLVVRYMRVQKGYFCSRCALKYFLGYTALTLVMGWWGLIGLFISPVFIIMNLVNMSKALLCYRRPLVHEVKERFTA